ncbi:hypothetical protein EWM64_g1617 [Hericium alpestre]|uniref:Ribosomal protein L38e n=1 Tax=Hericium alpestre TaxID=135208 RepID=A0A4Z0A8Y9_9AGAM|nr:hypothetical protein EWM64_g1617 [Hericium alpestre]
MPKEISAIKQFIDIAQRKDAKGALISCAMHIALSVRIKKTPATAGAKERIKFKIRCSRYLYTLSLDDAEKAEKLQSSLPPKLRVEEVGKAPKKK